MRLRNLALAVNLFPALFPALQSGPVKGTIGLCSVERSYRVIPGQRIGTSATHGQAEPIRVERLQANPHVEIRTRAVVEKIEGKDTVTGVLLEGGETLPVEGVFVEIGFLPATKLPLQLGVALDESGFIQVDEGCRTNVSGVYAAGDVTTGSNRMRQLVTAAAEGAIAAESLYEDLKSRPLEF